MSRRRIRTVSALYVLTVVAAYSSAVRTPFEFDDLPAIQQNESIRQLTPVSVPLDPPPNTAVTGRPFVNLTLAVNYGINSVLGIDQRSDPNGPNKTVGYHIFSILVHLTCSAFLFGILRRTLARETSSTPDWLSANRVAGLVVLLWSLHPIQTEAVDYVIQRTELLVSACYAATIYASIRAWDASGPPARRRWLAFGVVASLLGMASKEVMITAPVMVILYDRAFRSKSWKDLWSNRGRLGFYGALFTTALLVLVSVATNARGNSAGFGHGMAWYQYFYTQAWAVAHYIRLIAWPNALAFDYGEHPIDGLAGVPGAVLLTALAGGTIAAWRRPSLMWLGFLGAWFFLILAPSSSIVPIRTEIAAERRIYLASAPLFVLLVVGLENLARRMNFLTPRRVSAGLLVVAGLLAAITFARGLTYRSTEVLYLDVVAKRPENPRGYTGVGLAMLESGPSRFDEAAAMFQRAVTADSNYAAAWQALGWLAVMRNDWPKSLHAYRQALRLQPNNLNAVDGIARSMVSLGQLDTARQYVDRLGTSDVELLMVYGTLLTQRGRGHDAIPYLEKATAARAPRSIDLATMSFAYADAGRIDDAIMAAQIATEAAGRSAEVFIRSGQAMVLAHKPQLARAYFGEALKIDPGSIAAKQGLGAISAPK